MNSNDYHGQQLGNYRLVRRLGNGSFGQVYLAEHIYLKTLAAIKLLLESVDGAASAGFYEGFLQEARSIATLKHPHILRVLEFGMETATPYLVMEYAAHGTLLERHPYGTKVSLAQVVNYTNQLAQALDYAHEARLIHRDVKPANVLLDEHDTILLSDFGIATVAHHTSSMRTDSYAGTASYMAPEQLQGKPVTASDQYALAIMVYEWLCGQLPYQGDPITVGMQHLTAPIPALCIYNETLSPAVEAVVQQAMAKDPRQRFPTVSAFAQALEQAAQHNIIIGNIAPNNEVPTYPPIAPTVYASAKVSTGYQDRTLICRDCGHEFHLTTSEQELLASKGVNNTPRRCPPCRAAYRQSTSKQESSHPTPGRIGYQDRTLICLDCQQPFVFTADEQALLAGKGVNSTPRRCPPCRAAYRRKNSGQGEAYPAPKVAGYQDRTLICRDCLQPFAFTIDQQKLFANKGITNAPARCLACRAAYRAKQQ